MSELDEAATAPDGDRTRRSTDLPIPAADSGQADLDRTRQPAPGQPDDDRTRIRRAEPAATAGLGAAVADSRQPGSPTAAPSHTGPEAAPGPVAGPPPVARLMPPAPVIERSRVAEQFVTRTPPAGQSPAVNMPAGRPATDIPDTVRSAAEPAAAGREPAGVPRTPGAGTRGSSDTGPARPAAAPDQPPRPPDDGGPPVTGIRPDGRSAGGGRAGAVTAATQPAPAELFGPASIGGLGDQPAQPIVSLPPIDEQVAGYPISSRTGEPARNWAILAAMLAFSASALVALAAYWRYWWVAIHIDTFGSSAKLIELFAPRPGSGKSVVLVCVLAVIGAIMTAGPAVAGYNAWHGASFSRQAGLVACGTSLLAFFVLPAAWLALLFAAVGAGLLWLPRAGDFLAAWQAYSNPERLAIEPYAQVPYGPAPRFQ